MLKSGITVLIVDFVEDAVKFYTERLGFDIAEMFSAENSRKILFAVIKKGKCQIMFRSPVGDESIELTQVKHCPGRAVGVYVEMKKGIDKFFERCRKKKVHIVDALSEKPWGVRSFTIKDPFGARITFAEPIPNFKHEYKRFLGTTLDTARGGEDLVEDVVSHLRTFRITRRPAKKYGKMLLKRIKGKKK